MLRGSVWHPDDGDEAARWVDGAFLVDTGATHSAVDLDLVVKHLRLENGRMLMKGLHGAGDLGIYKCALALAIVGGEQRFMNLDVAGYPGLVKQHDDDLEVPVIGILGRDVLSGAVFSYDGINGRFDIAFAASTPRPAGGAT